MIHKQSENFNKEIENIKREQAETTKLINMIIELKNSMERFKSILDQVEERVRKVEGRAVEFIQSEEQKEKKN